MSRTKKTAETTEAPAAKRGRKKAEAVAPVAPAEVFISDDEKALTEKYPSQQIIPGSWRAAGAEDRPGHGHKRTVVIACCLPTCSHTRILATSDLQFETCKYCLTCVKDIKANRRRTKAAKKKLK